MDEKTFLLWVVAVVLALDSLLVPGILICVYLREIGRPVPWTSLLNPFALMGEARRIQREKEDPRLTRLIAMSSLVVIGNIVAFAVFYWAYFAR